MAVVLNNKELCVFDLTAAETANLIVASTDLKDHNRDKSSDRKCLGADKYAGARKT